MNLYNNILRHLKLLKLFDRVEQKEIERLFTRVFSNEDGQKVLAYLHYITTHRPTSPTLSEAYLRHNEGQRALVQIIQKLADRGRNE